MPGFLRKPLRILGFTATMTTLCLIAYQGEHTNHTMETNLFRSNDTSRGKKIDQSCGVLTFSRDHHPLTGLVSFPGSGNTWLRHMVQEATGFLTGSEYIDADLRINGFAGEGVFNESTILVKSHGSNKNTRERYAKSVLLIRHPKDAILAEFHRLYSGHHTGKASMKQFKAYWPSFLQSHSRAWYRFHQDWLKYSRSLLLLRFSDLEIKPSVVLKRLHLFLQVPTTHDRLQCALLHSTKYKREQKEDDDVPKNLFEKNFEKYLDWMYQSTLVKLSKLSTESNQVKPGV